MPTREQMEKFARDAERKSSPAPAPDGDDGWWDSVLSDPRAAGAPRLPVEQRRLNEIPRHVLRVECDRCFRVVEITRADAMKLWGPHVVLKDLAPVLLRDGCQVSAGRDDGCWPRWVAK